MPSAFESSAKSVLVLNCGSLCELCEVRNLAVVGPQRCGTAGGDARSALVESRSLGRLLPRRDAWDRFA